MACRYHTDGPVLIVGMPNRKRFKLFTQLKSSGVEIILGEQVSNYRGASSLTVAKYTYIKYRWNNTQTSACWYA